MSKAEPIAVGIDIGTTTITSLALGLESGEVLARATASNDTEITTIADKKRGRSEWDAEEMLARACQCLRQVTAQDGVRGESLVGIGVTGQQHGGLVVDSRLQPLTPLIGWQDRRLTESPVGSPPLIEEVCHRAGDSYQQTGCRMVPGFLGATLFWLHRNDCLPEGTAVFVTDLFAAWLANSPRVISDATNTGGSGVFDLQAGRWHDELIRELDLPLDIWPNVGVTGDVLGTVSQQAAGETGLPRGLPITIALGDHQAAYLGSVGDRDHSILVNVGTGGQVGGYCDNFVYCRELETRPFPRGGFLLVSPGLCGGRTYATLDRFFRDVGRQLFGLVLDTPLYEKMNAAAANIPNSAEMSCSPLFTGTRIDPMLRGSWTRVSPENLTTSCLVRSMLEGMARVYGESCRQIEETARRDYAHLVGSGNGLRENKLLAEFVSSEFARPLMFPRHTEEAAIGAALTATVGTGVFDSLPAASRWLQE